MYRTLQHLGHPEDLIQVQHLLKGNNVFEAEETQRMRDSGAERVIVLDQGSRPGPPLVEDSQQSGAKRVLIIDHHMSTEVRQGVPLRHTLMTNSGQRNRRF